MTLLIIQGLFPGPIWKCDESCGFSLHTTRTHTRVWGCFRNHAVTQQRLSTLDADETGVSLRVQGGQVVSASVCATFVSVYLRLAQGLDNRFSANVESKKEGMKNEVQRTLEEPWCSVLWKRNKTLLSKHPLPWRLAFCSALPARPPSGTRKSWQFHRVTDSQPRRKACLGCVGLTRSQVFLAELSDVWLSPPSQVTL